MDALPDDDQTPTQPDLLTPEASGVVKNTICIKVERGRFGTKRKAKTDAVQVQSDKSLLVLSKTILESPELKKVQQLDTEVTTFLKGLCLKSMFRGGIFLIPLGLVDEVNAALLEFQTRRNDLVDEAVKTYDTRAEETSARLRVLHEPNDYPSADRFKAKFYFEWSFITFETPTQLRKIKAGLFEIERQKAAAKLTAVADECRDAMRVHLADMVEHMVERLTPSEDGKKKIFKKKIVDNFQEFFRTFEMKNVTDDTELAAIAAKAQAVLQGIDVDSLRKDEALRDAMKAQFALLKDQLAPMTIDRSTRVIRVDDEDEEDVA